MKKKILVFCDFYLPGFKSGGGMLTILNLVDRFADRYDFYVVTRNYESKADKKPYTSVRSGAWNIVGNAKVYYLANEHYSLKNFASIVRELDPDIIYLNSAFSTPVVRFLIARARGMISMIPVVLAPCGEMSAGALSVKPLKKKLFLAYSRLQGLYKGLIWKASFETEKEDIEKVMGKGLDIMIAPDLPPKTILPNFDVSSKPNKQEGSARLLFLSRIARVKNVHYFLERLTEIRDGNLVVHLFGPLEDQEYWKQCLELIRKCSENVKINADPSFIPREESLRLMQENHFFILPTLGENYGYVFPEAMAAGTPIMISDRTIWNDLEKRNAGWEIPLERPELWIRAIRQCIDMGQGEYASMSANARQYSQDWLANNDAEAANALVLEGAASRQTRSHQ